MEYSSQVASLAAYFFVHGVTVVWAVLNAAAASVKAKSATSPEFVMFATSSNSAAKSSLTLNICTSAIHASFSAAAAVYWSR